MEITNETCQRGHDCRWLFFSSIEGRYCVACAIEFLECQEHPLILKCNTLKRLTAVMVQDSQKFIKCLSNRREAVRHFCTTIVNTTHETQSLELVSDAMQCVTVLFQFLGFEIGDILLECIISKCYSAQGCSTLRPLLTLLKELLVHSGELSRAILDDVTFTKFLTNNIDYPDNNIRIAILQLCLELIKKFFECPALLVGTLDSLPSRVMTLMSENDNAEILDACIDIIATCSVADDFLVWMSPKGEETDVSNIQDSANEVLTVLKSMLLKRNDRVTSKCVECIMILLGRHGDTIREPLLNADLAEFMYDALRSTTAYNLASSIYCCILLLAESVTFHNNCHAMYGFESVLRSLQVLLKTPQSTVCAQGITLLQTILDRQPGHATILSTLSLFDRTVEVIRDGLKYKHPDVVIASTETASSVIKYYPSTFPTTEIRLLIEDIGDNVLPLVTTQSNQDSEEIENGVTTVDTDEAGNTRETFPRKIFLAVWKVLYRACELLASKSHDDPALHVKESEEAVLDAIENSWLSLTTKTLHALSSPSIMHSMLATIVFVCQRIPRPSLVQKLIRGFIRIAMAAKARFSCDCRYIESANLCGQFLFRIISAGIQASLGEIPEDLQKLLEKGFSEIKGRLSECLLYLDGQFVDNSNLPIQCGTIALIFCLTWNRGRQVASKECLKSALFRYFVLKTSLKDLPLITARQLIFLCAWCDADPSTTPDVPLALSSILTDCNSFIRHPLYVSYILRLFSPCGSFKRIQSATIIQWLTVKLDDECEQSRGSVTADLLKEICKQNEEVIFTLLQALNDCPTESTTVVDLLVETIHSACTNRQVTSSNEKSRAVPIRIALDLSKYAYDRLLRSSCTTLSPSFKTFSRLLMMITQSDIDEDLEIWSYIIRILKLLLKLASENLDIDLETVSDALSLIKPILLCSNHANHAKSVLAATLCEKNFVAQLARRGFCVGSKQGDQSLTEEGTQPLPSSVEILAVLIAMQRNYNLPVTNALKIPFINIVEVTESRDGLMKRPVLKFWESVLDADFTSDLLTIHHAEDERVAERRTEVLRSVWNKALHLTMSCESRTKAAAYRCLLTVMRYASRKEDYHLERYLIHHPWLEIVLTRGLEKSLPCEVDDREPWNAYCMEIARLRMLAINSDRGDQYGADDDQDDVEDMVMRLL